MYKYMIVDDEQLIRKGIYIKVNALDLPLTFVGEAEDGEEALKLIEQETPDIVLTDMRMPVVDGVMFLQQLSVSFPDIKVIVISGYSDFEYMSQAISSHVIGYVLKPFDNQELRDCLDNAIAKIRMENNNRNEHEDERYRHDVNQLFNAMMSIKTELEISAEHPASPVHSNTAPFLSQKLQWLNTGCRFIVATLHTKPEEIRTDSKLSALQNELKDVIIIPNMHHPGQLIFLLHNFETDPQRPEPLDQAMKSMAAALHAADLQGITGFSSVKSGFAELHNGYRESVQALNLRKLLSASNLAAFPELNSQQNQAPSKDAAWINEGNLLYFIELGNPDKAGAYAQDLFVFFLKQPEFTLFQAKLYCRKLLTDAQMLPHQQNTSSFFEDRIEMIKHCYDIEELQKTFVHIVVEAAALFSGKTISSSEEVVQNIKKYIEQNYNRVLTLDIVSSLFYIHPTYCSILFKEKTGENFQDYVKCIRIDNAKRLLLHTPHKIERIAQLTGYDSTKYFYRVFKKEVGVSPAEFRNGSTSS